MGFPQRCCRLGLHEVAGIAGLYHFDEGGGGLVVLKFAKRHDHSTAGFGMGEMGMRQERFQSRRGMDCAQDPGDLYLHAPEGVLLQGLPQAGHNVKAAHLSQGFSGIDAAHDVRVMLQLSAQHVLGHF